MFAQKLYLRSFGCQMNDYDSSRLADLLKSELGTERVDTPEASDLVVINTCSIREKAQEKVFSDLGRLRELKRENPRLLIAVGGCVASQEGEGIIRRAPYVDIVFGPQTLHRLPDMIRRRVETGKAQVDVSFPEIEKFDHLPKPEAKGATAFVSIMEGCSKYCSYCVVPYTRGRERSRDPQTIVAEARSLFENGYREVTLLGQNVNSYKAGEVDFPELMRLVASVSPSLRVRFATSHPKDMSDRLLEVMASMPNICRAIHLPAQSGASSMLGRMNRKYTREWYLGRIAAIRRYLPDCAITTDLIAGFSGETEQEHEATLSLMREVGYEFAYMFKYSERPGTFAHEHLPDDVPDEVKSRRLSEIIALQNELGHASNLRDVGREFEVLVEGRSKRDEKQLSGRTSQNKVVVFDRGRHDVGDYVRVRITGCTPATLFGEEII